MKLISFMRSEFDLVPVEVEISLLPGLPQITFLGLPDTMIRESVGRIKSALKHQGFEFPQARQVLVQLRPAHMRKSSHGLDLAVAAGILWETGQITQPASENLPFVYGELSLKGEVMCPDDLIDLPLTDKSNPLWTGEPEGTLEFATYRLKELKDLAVPSIGRAADTAEQWVRPKAPELLLNHEAAKLIAVIAAGEHSALLAGPPGTGKTTAAEVLHSLLLPPDFKLAKFAVKLARLQGEELKWRPMIQPHHSITSLAMVGGGSPPRPGEITRAHGGLLVMDEFLEFHPAVQESLREPAERGEVRIARGQTRRSFPAKFLLVATTNLCPCGNYLPDRDELCRCAKGPRTRYLSRLRGPFVDRFAISAFTENWGKAHKVKVSEVLDQIDRADLFRRTVRKQDKFNSQLSESEAIISLSQFQRAELLPKEGLSKRRTTACLRVARTFADLDEKLMVENSHLEQALRLTVHNFQSLNRLGN